MSSYVVTGGRGIGLEFINQLSNNPSNTVFALVRKLASVPQLEELVAKRPNVHAFEADITDLPALKRAAEGVGKLTGGKLDVLINNAALVESGIASWTKPLDYYSGEGDPNALSASIKEMVDVNVIGPIETTNVFLPLLRAGPTKKVIYLSTGMADPEVVVKASIDVSPVYAITKAAMNMAVSKFAASLQSEGFIFLAISPGLVDTKAGPQDPPSEDVLKAYGKMITGFRQVAPHFSGVPITPEESVLKMRQIIDTLKPEENGAFISHHRNKEWL